jgi:hypothetical protein
MAEHPSTLPARPPRPPDPPEDFEIATSLVGASANTGVSVVRTHRRRTVVDECSGHDRIVGHGPMSTAGPRRANPDGE